MPVPCCVVSLCYGVKPCYAVNPCFGVNLCFGVHISYDVTFALHSQTDEGRKDQSSRPEGQPTDS